MSERWSDERDAQLIALVEEGLTTVEIAVALEITKSAVEGRTRRLRQAGRLTESSPVRDHFLSVMGGLRGDQCRWIEGTPHKPDFTVCPNRSQRGSAWCPEHYARAYTRKGG